MTFEDFLITKIMEEACELAQAASKMKLYGVHHKCEKCNASNFENFKQEVIDLLGTITQFEKVTGAYVIDQLEYSDLEPRMRKNEKYYKIHSELLKCS